MFIIASVLFLVKSPFMTLNAGTCNFADMWSDHVLIRQQWVSLLLPLTCFILRDSDTFPRRSEGGPCPQSLGRGEGGCRGLLSKGHQRLMSNSVAGTALP